MGIKQKIFCLIVFIVSLTIAVNPAKGQVLKDTATFRMMCKGVDYIYNMQFTKAREVFREVARIYPDHPIIYVYKGLITYWENYPLTPASPQKEAFEKDMEKAISICDKYPNLENDPEYLLANIGARGLLLLFYADNDLTKEVIPLASSTYQYVKLSFNYTKTYADFYFITGLYNYYREAYPDAHPVYKSIAFLFPKGDKARGLKEMQYASKNAVVLKAESFSFLSGIYISFENNFDKAYQYSKALYDLYPRNLQYISMYIKNLLLVKRYDEAENLIKKYIDRNDNNFFNGQLLIYNGILSEKKYRDYRQAQLYYNNGIKELESYGEIGTETMAYGYFGLSRITADKHLRKDYRKKAIDLAAFKNVNFDK
jgi:hypothetical protein